MWTRDRFRTILGAAGFVLLLGVMGAGQVARANSEVAPASADLGTAISERFEVVALSHGLLLKAKNEEAAVRTVEIPDRGTLILVNNKPLTEQEMRAWLGRDGELLAELLDLDSDERRELLGLPEAEERQRLVVEAPPMPPVPPLPRIPDLDHVGSDARLSFGHSVVVESDEVAEDVVSIGGSIDVEGEVLGDAVSVGGSVEISGKVTGDVVSVGGSVHLEPTAEVFGDVVSIGGGIDREDGAKVLGESVEIGPAGLWFNGWGDWGRGHGRDRWAFPFSFFFGDVADLFWRLLGTAVLILVVCLLVLLARRPVEDAERRLAVEPWKAGLVGLLAELLFVPLLILVVVVLAVSIIGIPLLLLVPFACLAFVLAFFIGYTAAAYRLGLWVMERFSRPAEGLYVPVIVGVVVIQALSIFAKLLGLAGGPFGWIALLLGLAGWVVRYLAWTVGLGAVLLGLLSRDWRRARPALDSATVPPPPPSSPPAPPAEAASSEALPEPPPVAPATGGEEPR